jgi:hypothetical protein
MNPFHEREIERSVWGLTENACLLAYEREQYPSAPPAGDDAHLISEQILFEVEPHGPSSPQELTTAAFVWIEQLLDHPAPNIRTAGRWS